MDFLVFPTDRVKAEIAAYTERLSKPPKILVISNEDYADYLLTYSLPSAQSLGLEKIERADYLPTCTFELVQE